MQAEAFILKDAESCKQIATAAAVAIYLHRYSYIARSPSLGGWVAGNPLFYFFSSATEAEMENFYMKAKAQSLRVQCSSYWIEVK